MSILLGCSERNTGLLSGYVCRKTEFGVRAWKTKSGSAVKVIFSSTVHILDFRRYHENNSFLNGLYVIQFSIYNKLSGYFSIDISMLDGRNTSSSYLYKYY